jgi:plastocyanin
VQASASTGYTAPVFELKSGSSLTWVSTDIGHISVDGAPLVASASPCVRDSVPGNLASQPARFDIRGGMLTATLGATTLTCGNAQALPDGSFELPYYCALHANMRGLLLVSP